MQRDRLPFKKFSKGEMKGWLKEEILNSFPSGFFGDPVSFVQEMGGNVLKESRLRWASIFTLPTGQRVFLKRDKTKDWIESLKYLLLPSKARKEWVIAYRLQKRNLNIPKPLGWMEKVRWGFVKESYYLSEAIGSGTSLIDDRSILKQSSSVGELAKAVRKFHDAGLFHKDLHAGNFLRDNQSVFLTDLHRAKIIQAVSSGQRLWNLSQLLHSLRSVWGIEERSRFIEAYFEKSPLSPRGREELLQKIHSSMDRLQKRQWRSRTKRCLKESTEFSVFKERGIHYYHRRDFSLGQIRKVLGDHLDVIRERPSELKKLSQEVIVSLSNDSGNRVCVKQFRYPNFWKRFKENFRRSKGLRAWIAGNGLRARGFQSLSPLGLVEKRDWLGLDVGFLLMEALEIDLEMDRYISDGLKDFWKKRLFIKLFAQWLSNLHKMDIYHRDMKTCNILVSKSGAAWDFYLLDLEDVQLDKKVDGRRLFRNFVQLNTSTPKVMTRTDRFRFFKEYIKLNPIVKNRKGFLQRLIVESKRRGLVYVSPQGLVEEKSF